MEPRGPFWVARGAREAILWCPWCGGGYTTPPPPHGHHRRAARAPRATPERASGLNGPRGVRVAGTQGRHAALGFPYLRSFWPGSPDGLQAVRDNRWIGSRSRPAWAGLDVSDLECLERGCGCTRTSSDRAPARSGQKARSRCARSGHFFPQSTSGAA